jgi:DMSO/TMAO reductase YedYZ molybdopterin-dependent catalytic subunit
MRQGPPRISRREALVRSGGALAALAVFDSPLFAWGREGETTIAFLDQPPAPPVAIPNLLDWQQLDSWLVPSERFFAVSHFGSPDVDAQAFRLEVGGQVARPGSYSLDEIKALPRKELVFTLECSGNSGFDWFQGGIGNARWAGAPLQLVLERAGITKRGVEVVFYGADAGEETVPYVGGLGNRMGDINIKMNFARSMSVQEALDPSHLLCYEMNGAALPKANGHPLRLIAPGWYGIANVKWLTRIEVRDSRFLGPFMATRYVTVREQPPELGGGFMRSSVGRSLLKSITAKVTLKDGRHRIYGAAWGAPIARAEVRIDDGPWSEAVIDRGQDHEFAWKFWHADWNSPAPGEHRITSRAVDTAGNLQPAMDDWRIAKKHTYWEANGQITRRIRI